MRITNLITLLVLSFAMVDAAAVLNVVRSKRQAGGITKSGIRKPLSSLKKASPKKASPKKATVKNPLRGQTLYIMLEYNTAPADLSNESESHEQIVQFLHQQKIWDALDLAKYRKPDSDSSNPHSLLNLRIHGYPHPENDQITLHFSIAGPEKCDGEPYGCKVEFLRQSPESNFLITNKRPGEVAMIYAEEPTRFALS
ncbi:hypothetical protein GGU11DRAFT_370508 [Lentinula aff. detonsa]|nr:hypothetical protein GGU11DRAFT_370508 [Lentinula aff. detonsa]